jgi:hypothetical protein
LNVTALDINELEAATTNAGENRLRLRGIFKRKIVAIGVFRLGSHRSIDGADRLSQAPDQGEEIASRSSLIFLRRL